MAYLVFVRHGESEYNAQDIICGDLESPLTERGREQIAETVVHLRDIRFTQAFTTPLQRAQETLEIILESLDMPLVPVIADALRERNWAPVQGKPDSAFSKDDWAEWTTWEGKTTAGESYADVHKRVIPWITAELLPLAAQENVLVVAHNGVMKVIRQFFEHHPKEKTFDLNTPNAGALWYEVSPELKVTPTAPPAPLQ